MKDNRINEWMQNENISIVSDQDMIMPSKNSDNFGIYLKSKEIKNHWQCAVWNWATFYEKSHQKV